MSKRLEQYKKWIEQLSRMPIPKKRHLLLEWKVSVQLKETKISIFLQLDPEDLVQTITVEAKLVRKGNELKLALSPDNHPAKCTADPTLLKLIAHAFAAREHLISGIPSPPVANYSKQHISKLARLSYVAPDIVTAITNGSQPPQITARHLPRNGNLSLDWNEQRKQLGFG